MVVINVRVPQDVYDALCQLARREREPLPAVVRNALLNRTRTAASL